MNPRYKNFSGVPAALLWLLVIACPGAFGAESASSFEQANTLYEQEKFVESAATYQKIADAGRVSPELYFNLGNALFKSGRIGDAILNYRVAERLAPRDPDIRANLQFARNNVSSNTRAAEHWLERAVRRMTLNEWTAWTLGGWWAWMLLLAVARLRPAWAASCKSYAIVAAIFTLMCGSGLFVAHRQQFTSQDAVVTVQEAIARYGPLDKSPSYFSLGNGAEIRVLDRHNGWIQVGDNTGRKGWVSEDSVRLVAASKQ